MHVLHTHDALPVNVNLQLPILVERCPHIQNVTCRASWSSTGGFNTDGNIIQLHERELADVAVKLVQNENAQDNTTWMFKANFRYTVAGATILSFTMALQKSDGC